MAIVEANYTYAGRFITHLARTQMCFFFSFFPKTSGSVSEASAPEWVQSMRTSAEHEKEK